LFSQKIKVHRDINPEKTIKGKKAPSKYETFEINASVQPFEPDAIVEEEIGSERNSHAIKIYSDKELRVIDETKRLNADLVEYEGELFEIRRVDKWQKNRMNLVHFKSIAFKVNKELPK
jgi:hypothetical protein